MVFFFFGNLKNSCSIKTENARSLLNKVTDRNLEVTLFIIHFRS